MKSFILLSKIAIVILILLPSISYADVTGTTTTGSLDPYELGYDFVSNGIYYKITSDSTVSTSEGEKEYSGTIIIPDIVRWNSIDYKVTKVSGFRNSPNVTEITIPKYTKTISGFYGRVHKTWGGPGIKSGNDDDTEDIEPQDSTSRDTAITTVYSKLERVNFNAINCENVYFSIHQSSLLGGGYHGYTTPFPFSLKSIVFGEDVERIPNGLLYGCRKIESIVFPKSVKYIGWMIISEDADNVTKCELRCEDLQEIAWLPKNKGCVELKSSFQTYPAGKKHYLCEDLYGWIDASTSCNMFHDFIGLRIENGEIHLPEWVKKIAPKAFSTLDVNFTLELSENITTLEEEAFANCNKLQKVVIPNTVTHIGNRAFNGCSNLKTLYFNAGNCTTGTQIFKNCSSLTEVIFGEDVTKVPNKLFSHCTGIKKIDLPNNITEIGTNSFMNSSISEITIPNSVTTINDYAFNSCEKLKTLNFNAENCVLGSSVFSGCDALSDVNFGLNVKKIPDGLLRRCEGVKKIEIPNTVVEIGNYAFQYSGLTEITIPTSVEKIGQYAFGYCDNLKSVYYDAKDCTTNQSFYKSSINSVEFGGNVVKIPESLFLNCNNITSVKLSDSVKEIGQYALFGIAITDLTIPKNVSNIARLAFGSENLTTLYYNAKNCDFEDEMSFELLTNLVIGEDVEKLPSYFLYDCNNLTELTIPENIDSIGGFSINFCENLKKVYFNAENCNIETIAAPNEICNVFWACTALEEVVIGDNVTIIPNNLFDNCSSLKKVSMSNSVKSIGNYAFSTTALETVMIPENVTFMGDGAFSSCDSLKSLYYNAEFCNMEGNNESPIFAFCNALENVVFGENVKNIPFGLLYYCQNLTEVQIPNSVVEIGAQAFNGSNLSKIEIPDNVVKIGERAFQHCYNVSSIKIGKSVEEIGKYAFRNCSSANLVTSLSQIPPMATDVIFNDYTYNYGNLNVPTNSVDDYKKATGWKNFKKFTGVNVSGVNDISNDEDISPIYYNLQGNKVENPQNGVFIKYQGNKVTKVTIN